MDTALVIKIVAVALVLASAFVGAYVPRRFGMSDAGRRKLVLGSAFAAGVFLGGGLIHLLPDAHELLGKDDFGGDYPMAAFIAAVGFMMVLIFEHVIGAETSDEGEHRSSAAILLVVLGVHSVIAGFALGLEQSAGATARSSSRSSATSRRPPSHSARRSSKRCGGARRDGARRHLDFETFAAVAASSSR